MDTVYIPGDGLAFKAFIDEHYYNKKAEIRNIDGEIRWIITRDDGTEYIARPESANHA